MTNNSSRHCQLLLVCTDKFINTQAHTLSMIVFTWLNPEEVSHMIKWYQAEISVRCVASHISLLFEESGLLINTPCVLCTAEVNQPTSACWPPSCDTCTANLRGNPSTPSCDTVSSGCCCPHIEELDQSSRTRTRMKPHQYLTACCAASVSWCLTCR